METAVSAGGADAASGLKWETLKLDNGLTAVLSPREGLPMVSLEMRIGAGSVFDQRGKEGLANLTARMIRQGSILHDAESIDALLDSRGASLEVGATADYASFSLTCLADDFPELLSLLAEIVLSPAFDDAEFARTRAEWVERVRRGYASGGTLARDAFYTALYPHGGYGNPSEGYPKTIAGLDVDSVIGFYNAYYHPGRCQISVVGPMTSGALLKQLYAAFGGWAEMRSEPVKLNDTPGAPGRVIIVDAPLTQANVRIGARSLPTVNPDYFRLRFVNEVLGGSGMTSRLGDTIRNKNGLAYSVFSWNPGFRDAGSFFIAFSTKVESARTAVDMSFAEVAKLLAEPPGGDEMAMTKAGLSGRLYFQLETYSGAAGQIAEAQWSGLGRDYFTRQTDATDAMNAKRFSRIAKKYLSPDDFIVVIAGPADELKKQFADKEVEVVKIPE